MTSNSLLRGTPRLQFEESNPTAGSPACGESATGCIPTRWATQCNDESPSATFRALAWSKDDDLAAEPAGYRSDDYVSPEAISSPPEWGVDGPAVSLSAPGHRWTVLLHSALACIAAAAVGGLVMSATSADNMPTISTVRMTQPAIGAPHVDLGGETARDDAVSRSFVPAPPPAPISRPPRVTGSGANGLRTTTIAPEPAAEPARDVPVQEVPAPPVTTPAVSAAEDTSPIAAGPLDTPPPVSVPVVTPEPVPHPVGPPPVFHVPTEPAGSSPEVSGPPVLVVPPVLSAHPGITLPPNIVVTPQIPNVVSVPGVIGSDVSR